MNFANLSKERKQYLILGALVFAAVIGGGVIGIKWSLSSVTQAKAELADLEDKITRADRSLKRKNQTVEDFARTTDLLRTRIATAPPENNHYSWATEIIYSNGRDAGLEVESVEEIAAAASDKSASDGEVKFASYSIRVKARGDYEQTKTFLLDIEERYPLVRFTGVEISAGQGPEKHELQLFMQWPFQLREIAKVWEDVDAKHGTLAKFERKKASSQNVVEPVVAVVEPEPEPEVPEPVVNAEPEPFVAVVPAEEVAPIKEEAKPEEVVEPVVAVVEPEPEPEVPEPVVNAEPEPFVAVVPAEEVAPIKEEAKPEEVVEPVVAVVEPEPEVSEPVVNVEPEPVVAVVPAVEVAPIKEEAKPEEVVEPVVAVVEPEPEPEVSAPVVAAVESMPEVDVFEVSPTTELEESSMNALLASLDSRGGEPEPEPEPVNENVYTDAESLEALVRSLEESRAKEETDEVAASPEEEPVVEAMVETEPAEEPVKEVVEEPVVVAIVEPEPAPAEPSAPPVQYVSSGKSAKKLEALLNEGKPKANVSLGSFLDGFGGTK